MNKRIICMVALSVSLALNVFFGSVMLGKFAGRMEQGNGKSLKLVMQKMRDLPPEQREKAAAIVRDTAPQLRATIAELKQERTEVFDQLKSPDYQRSDVEPRLIAVREKTNELQAVAQTLMLDFADQLTPEQRAEFFARQGNWEDKFQP